MTLFIKEIEFKGFKSFYSRTNIPFKEGLNVIIGPNGSGKSNIVDALLFVFGTSSRKELRAEKFEHLIFAGNQKLPAAKFAEVKIKVNNENRILPIDSDEVIISRRVDRDGKSIYKINGRRETREALISLLSHANIGSFNIVKQGEIAKLVEQTPMERKAMIDDIAGISFFEEKKEKSMKELEKVESKLKEVAILLTEKRKYLEELENEKKEAEAFLRLRERVEFLKKAILAKEIEEKEKELQKLEATDMNLKEEKERIESEIGNLQARKAELEKELKEVNKQLDLAGEKEQIELRRKLIDVHNRVNFLKTKLQNTELEIERLRKRRENMKQELDELRIREESLTSEISELKEIIPKLRARKEELEKLLEVAFQYERFKEMQRKLKLKDELEMLKPKLQDLERKIKEISRDLDALRKERERIVSNLSLERSRVINFVLSLGYEGIIGPISDLIKLPDELRDAIPDELLDVIVVRDLDTALKCIRELREKKIGWATFMLQEAFTGDVLSTFNLKLDDLNNLIGKRGITKDGIFVDGNLIKGGYKRVKHTAREIKEMQEKAKALSEEIQQKESTLRSLQKEYFKLKSKVDFLAEETREIEEVPEVEEVELSEVKPELDKVTSDLNSLSLSLQAKENELENIVRKDIQRIHSVLKELDKEEERLLHEMEETEEELKEQETLLSEVEAKEREFFERMKDMKRKREEITKEISKINKEVEKLKEKLYRIAAQINELKLKKAQVKSKLEALKYSGEELPKVERSKGDLERELKEKEERLKKYRFVNLKALEVYGEVEKEYMELKGKVDKIKEERAKVIEAIREIEKKKLQKFMQIFNTINENFQRIYAQLAEGKARLKLENEENPLEGGVDIEASPKGKMVNIRALSGGEKTIVALAFLLAIQELLPAPFYVFDEVDAALDKMNSEKLAKLLKESSKSAQIIVISHNDAVISEADQLYGVSMNENGESQIVSLKL